MAVHAKKTVNLALQGGGSHGAFTWGVLDRFLDEDRLEICGISGTSAGAMNAAMFKTGYIHEGRQGARLQLDRFWGSIEERARASANPVTSWLRLFSEDAAKMAEEFYDMHRQVMQDTLMRSVSPYEWNPLDLNPLRDLLEGLIDFKVVCADRTPHLFIGATNVRSGKVKIFEGHEISTDAILASACLPFLFRAVEIEGEAYWDGGYMGNPALFPLFNSPHSRDIVIVVVNPIERSEIPRSARDILNRINEVSFNSSLLRELRAINFVQRLISDGRLTGKDMKDILIHAVRDDATMSTLGAETKLNPSPEILRHLKARGRAVADDFLVRNWAKLGTESSVDLRAMFD